MKRSQAAVEYIVILGVILVILIPLFFYAVSKSSESIRISQAEDVINSLGKAADEVYALSPGTKKYVWVNIPSGVQDARVNGSEIYLTMDIFGGTSDIVALTKAPVIGEIPVMKGTYHIPVELLDSGIVLIGAGGDDDTPPVIIWKYPGGLACNPIILKANTDEPAICRFDVNDVDYGEMSLRMSGNALGHNYNLGVQNEGDYTYFARCVDAFSNEMDNSETISYSINFTYCGEDGDGGGIEETEPPVVTLINPPPGYTANTSEIDFLYNIIDDSPIFLCRLIIDGSILETVYEPAKETTNTIIGNLDIGNYIWSVNCTDSFGNEGNSSERSIVATAVLDTDYPEVNLIAPINESIKNFNMVKFFYNVTDLTSGIYSCTILIFSILDGGGVSNQAVTDFSVTEGEQESLSLGLNKGNHTWNISCKDDSVYRNEGISEAWWFRINSTTEESFITSCAGQCGWAGYSNGICENNIAKCSEFCDNCHMPEGDEYCIGGPESDTCCCVP